MEKIYDQAKDQNIAAIMIYGKASDTKAYVDSACKTQFKTSQLKDAFLKRAIVQIGTDYFIPVAFSVSTAKVGTVTYAKAGDTAGTAATGTLVSVADSTTSA